MKKVLIPSIGKKVVRGTIIRASISIRTRIGEGGRYVSRISTIVKRCRIRKQNFFSRIRFLITRLSGADDRFRFEPLTIGNVTMFLLSVPSQASWVSCTVVAVRTGTGLLSSATNMVGDR